MDLEEEDGPQHGVSVLTPEYHIVDVMMEHMVEYLQAEILSGNDTPQLEAFAQLKVSAFGMSNPLCCYRHHFCC